MTLLLDTQVLIWWDEGRRLSGAALRAVREAQVYLSPVSAWEIAMKTALGRIHPARTVEEAAADSGFLELPITLRHAARVAALLPITEARSIGSWSPRRSWSNWCWRLAIPGFAPTGSP